MKKIKPLSDLIISQIAAGEVIERPVSVVKELVENAIDSGADRIYIRVEEGGQKSIVVIDNGSGISKEDLPNVFARHATSKFESMTDFDSLSTHGFRGEAIASIASVAQVTVETATESTSGIGHKMQVFGGETVLPPTIVGRSRGTSVSVENLFYNTPARKKFLKSAVSEMSLITDLISKYVLIYSGIQFVLEQKGKEYIRSYGSNQSLNDISLIYGRDALTNMNAIDFKKNGVSIQGYVSNSTIAKRTRKQQLIAINGRLIQNALLYQAVEEGVRSYMPPGFHPIVVLNIHLNNKKIDVNAHPRKEQIRFQNEEELMALITEAIQESLGLLQAEEQKLEEDSLHLEYNVSEINKDILDFKILGQLKDTYMMVEIFDKIMIIDQHAAHEAIIYHYLKESVLYRREQMPKETLLSPVVVEITPAQEISLQNHIKEIAEMGFNVEPFGYRSLIVREVPSGLDHGKVKAIIEEILNEGITSKNDWLKNALIMTSCKSAIKANQPLEESVMNKMVRELILNQITNCPHGRPLYFTMSVNELERKFNRIV